MKTIKTTPLAAFVAVLTLGSCGANPTPVDTTEPSPKVQPDPFQPDQCAGLICPNGQTCSQGLCVDNTQTPKFGSIEVATVTLLAKADVYLDGAMLAKMADLPYLIEMVRAGMEHTVRLGAPNWEGRDQTVMVMAEQKAVVQPPVLANVDDLVGEWREIEWNGQPVFPGSFVITKVTASPDARCPSTWTRLIGFDVVGTLCVLTRDRLEVFTRGRGPSGELLSCNVETDRVHLSCTLTPDRYGGQGTMLYGKYPN